MLSLGWASITAFGFEPLLFAVIGKAHWKYGIAQGERYDGGHIHHTNSFIGETSKKRMTTAVTTVLWWWVSISVAQVVLWAIMLLAGGILHDRGIEKDNWCSSSTTEGDGPFINCLRRLESLCILGWRCTIDVSLKIMRAAVRVIREAESCTRAFPTFNALKMGMAAAAHPSRKRKRMRATQSMTSAPLSSADTATAMPCCHDVDAEHDHEVGSSYFPAIKTRVTSDGQISSGSLQADLSFSSVV